MDSDFGLLGRWSRQDRLALAVVILAVGFLTGTAVVMTATADQTTAIAANLEPGGSIAPADQTTAQDGIPLGVLDVGTPDGGTVLLGGPPSVETVRIPGGLTQLHDFPRTGLETVGPPDEDTIRLTGPKASRTLAVTTVASNPLFPPWWLRSNDSLPGTLGEPQHLTLQVTNDSAVPTQGVPLRGALAFFLTGTRQLQALLSLTALGASVLVGVTIYSVTRRTVQRRRHTIGVLRTTGATRSRVAGLLVGRVLALTALGIAIGYALGLIAPNVVVNLAVFAEMPVTLSARLTPAVVGLLVPIYGLVLLVAGLAAAGAVWQPLRAPPATLLGRTQTTTEPTAQSRFPTWLRPTLLDPRTAIPATAILAALIVFVLVLVAIGGAIAPLTATQDATITEPGASHPLASSVPAGYAEALRSAGVPASAELLLFSVTDGDPFLTRGAAFESFASVRDVRIVAGRQPRTPEEAVIGADLATTLGIERGETMLLGGSTSAAATRVRIVGVFAGPGLVDDQLVVPLATGAHLTGRPPGRVHYIRTAGRPDLAAGPTDLVVLTVETPRTVVSGAQTRVQVTVANPTSDRRSKTLTLRVDGSTTERSVTIPPFSQRTVTFEIGPQSPGSLSLEIANRTRTLTVVDPQALRLGLLPETVPLGSEPLLRVTRADGTPIRNATVTVGDRSYETGADGRVRVAFPEAGESTVTVSVGDRTLERTVTVRENAIRHLVATLGVSPSEPSVLSTLTASVTLFNPWNEPLSERVRVTVGGETRTRTVTVEPGDTTTVTFDLGRFPPGDIPVALAVDDSQVAIQTVTVAGDERLASVLATQGRTGAGSTLGQAAQALLGNVWIVAAILLGLATAMGVGSSTAVFARAVAARRHTIGVHRATGASPRRVLGLVLADILRIGVPATLAAMGIALATVELLGRFDVLVVFGIRLEPAANAGLLLAIGLGALALLVIGASLATVRLVRQPPARALGRTDTGFESESQTTDAARPERQ